MKILLLNAGSSSLKCTLMEAVDRQVVAHGLADWAGSVTHYQYAGPDGKEHSEEVSWRGHAEAVRRVLHDLMHAEPVALPERSALAAVGHRVVHGGQFTSSVRITPAIRSRITALADLAPLHNPPSLATLAAAEAELPGVPHVAVFDTAFHATLPPEARTYPVPERWTRDWGIRRFGFHGLSHAYCSRRAAELLGRPPEELRLVICHLGHGCSASAVRGGRCVDTTMGFTPLEGLMMGTAQRLDRSEHRAACPATPRPDCRAGRGGAQSRIGFAGGVGPLGRHAAGAGRRCGPVTSKPNWPWRSTRTGFGRRLAPGGDDGRR